MKIGDRINWTCLRGTVIDVLPTRALILTDDQQYIWIAL